MSLSESRFIPAYPYDAPSAILEKREGFDPVRLKPAIPPAATMAKVSKGYVS
jgi:hypothetical protein